MLRCIVMKVRDQNQIEHELILKPFYPRSPYYYVFVDDEQLGAEWERKHGVRMWRVKTLVATHLKASENQIEVLSEKKIKETNRAEILKAEIRYYENQIEHMERTINRRLYQVGRLKEKKAGYEERIAKNELLLRGKKPMEE